MHGDSNILSLALSRRPIWTELAGQEARPFWNFNSGWGNEPATRATGAVMPAGQHPDSELDQLVQELTCLYQTARTAYECSRSLLIIVRPFLPDLTWRKATEVARHGERTLPTETCEISILRLDIANFTELMDGQPLDRVLTDLKGYLDRLTRLVYHHHGDVDKYLGDGFLAIFADADDAVQAGSAIQQAAAEFNHRQSVRGGLVFPSRIAIDTGQVAVTSLGSPNRQERSIIGMPVNLAERLQAQATPGRVWLSQDTFDRLKDRSGCRYLGAMKVKGKAEPVVVYEKG